MAHHELCRFVQKLAPALYSRLIVKLEGDGAMDDAACEMTIDDGIVSVLGEERLELPKIIAELVRRDRAVLPSGPGIRMVRHVGFRPKGIVTNVPDPLLLVLVLDQLWIDA